jgi:hypothetical protein
MNDLERYADVFKGMTPWSGPVPAGYLVDFLGVLTDARFRVPFGIDPAQVGGGAVATRLPVIGDGEGWFEAVNWIKAARAARGRYVMVTLGACYGAQAVGACAALRALNPMPCRLVAVEPEPENCQWVRRHMRDNGIDLNDHWLVPLAISDRNDPVLFPVGSPGSGAQNCVSTNEPIAREIYARQMIGPGRLMEALRNLLTSTIRETYARDIIGTGRRAETLRNLLVHNTTGLTKDLVPGSNFMTEIKFVSAVTLGDILGPLDRVDYLESDIQQSEILVFPPFIDLLRRKVRRIHIGTHGKEVHQSLHQLFAKHGWDIVFSYEPNGTYDSPIGRFRTNDGVLTVKNPAL